MKKCLILLLGTVWMIGCTKVEPTPPKPVTEFTAQAEITRQDAHWGGILTADIATLTLALSYPETVSGLTYAVNGETVTLSYGALSAECPAEGFPRESTLRRLHSDLCQCRSAGVLLAETQTEDGWRFCSSDGRLTAETDADGNILFLADSAIQLAVRFYRTE